MIDNINFHKYLKMCREISGVTLEELGSGLYSKAMMSRIEKGKSLPDYFMRNRIMSRLGISSEGYEDFLQSNEYDKYLKRVRLMELVENKNILDAEKVINEQLENHVNELSKIEYQFVCDMKARCMIYNSEDIYQIYTYYRKACESTIDLVALKKGKIRTWSVQEYFLIFKMLEAYAKTRNEKQEILGVLNTCILLLNYIDNEAFDSLGKAKVYPMGASVLGNLVKQNALIELYGEKVLEVSTKAIEYLRLKGRSYYLIELLEQKIFFDEVLHSAKNESLDKKRLEVFKYIYETEEVDGYMEYNCYIYRDSEIFCIGDVIKSRRELLGITREVLSSESCCSYRTLMRIENKLISAQRYELDKLLRNLNLSANYMRSDIVTDKKEVMDNYFHLIKLLNNDPKSKDIDRIIANFTEIVDLSNYNNIQIFEMIKSIISLKRKEIGREEFTQHIKELLALTIPLPINCLKQGYLTHAELVLLKGVMKNTTNEAEKEYLLSYLKDYCEQHLYESHPSNYGNYENIMIWVADSLCDKKENEIVEEVLKKLLHVQLKSHRVFQIHSSMYMMLRNEAIQDTVFSNDYLNAQMDMFLLICDFGNYRQYRKYYELIKDKINSGENWMYY